MVIGLTGKICSGKNFIGRLLQARGFEVWDLDREAEKIRKAKRTEIFNAFGTTDSEELAQKVFNNPKALKQLEDLIYPDLKEKIKAYPFDLVINGALLNRAGFDSLCSFIIFVDAPYQTRKERALKQRHLSEQEFERRNNSQSDVNPESYCCPVHLLENSEETDSELMTALDAIMGGKVE